MQSDIIIDTIAKFLSILLMSDFSLSKMPYKYLKSKRANAIQKKAEKKYNQSEKGIKRRLIGNWKNCLKMIADDWEEVYNIYQITECCNYCCKTFKNSYDKHLDHNHQTGEIRGVLCRSCNSKDVYASDSDISSSSSSESE